MRPRLLDLFCGAGGCAVGYDRAGFDVTGVDNRPQPRYPFAFHQADALEFLAAHGREYDAIHASPPCQAYSRVTKRWGRTGDHPDLIGHVRDMLAGYAVPWVIENVGGAPLCCPFMLCGSMFGLKVRRHRWFESSDVILAPCCRHRRHEYVVQVNGNPGGSSRRDSHIPRHTADEWAKAMGIDWMTAKELSQAVPPAYAEFIGLRLMALVTC